MKVANNSNELVEYKVRCEKHKEADFISLACKTQLGYFIRQPSETSARNKHRHCTDIAEIAKNGYYYSKTENANKKSEQPVNQQTNCTQSTSQYRLRPL